jgi:hypothetical protein
MLHLSFLIKLPTMKFVKDKNLLIRIFSFFSGMTEELKGIKYKKLHFLLRYAVLGINITQL